MNAYGIAILATLLFSYALDVVSILLNLKALREELPPDFEGSCDAEEYRRSQAYTRVRTRFSLVSESVGLAITLGFWFSGGFNLLDGLVREWVERWGAGPLVCGLVYIGALLLARAILDLPLGIYSTFVIEERFGFNKTTPKIFVADWIKGLALGIVLGAPLLAALLFLLDEAGPNAWIYCWAVVTAFSLFLQFVFPTWIMPLFNKFESLKEGELRQSMLTYARSVEFPMENIVVMDGSRRSSKSNAYFAGFGKRKRLALFDTLIEKHSVPELVAILAHEVGHYKKKHVFKSLALGITHSGLIFFLLSVFISHGGLFDAFYMEHMSVYAGLLFFGMLFTPIALVISIALHIFSRRNEYEADHFAATTIESSEDMVDALKKLYVDNLSNLTPHPFFVFLHDSHPPVLLRIRAIRDTTAAEGTAVS